MSVCQYVYKKSSEITIFFCESIFTKPTASVDSRVSTKERSKEQKKFWPFKYLLKAFTHKILSKLLFFHPRSLDTPLSTINCGEMRNGFKWTYVYARGTCSLNRKNILVCFEIFWHALKLLRGINIRTIQTTACGLKIQFPIDCLEKSSLVFLLKPSKRAICLCDVLFFNIFLLYLSKINFAFH